MGKFKITAAFVVGGVINAESRTLEGVSVITEGPALGHGVLIDSMSLATVKTCAEEYRGGLKVKVNHYSGTDAIVGRLTNFRIDGPQLRADLSLLKNHALTPLLLEMAQTMPESFGLSISFSGQIEEDDQARQLMRCLEIYSCDIVDQPAANPTGLFSAQIDNQTNSMTIETPEFLALQAEHKTTCELATTLKTDLEAKTAEVTSLSAQLSEVTTKLQDADKAITELKASMEKAAAEHAAALSDFDKKVADKAAMTLAASGTQPVTLGASNATLPVLEQLNAITNPAERTAFFRKHKADIMLARK